MDLPDAAHDSPTAFARASAAAQYLRSIVSVPELAHPRTAIVCGSGLGGLQHALMKEPRIEVPYEKIAGMPKSTGKASCRPAIVLALVDEAIRLTMAVHSTGTRRQDGLWHDWH